MKVLIVTGIYPPDSGGPASFVPRLQRTLNVRGFDIAVVTLSDVPAQGDDPSGRVIRIPRDQRRLDRQIQLVKALGRQGRDAPVWLVQGLNLFGGVVGWLMRKPQVHKVVGDSAWEFARTKRWFSGSIDAFQKVPFDLRFAILRLWITIPLHLADMVVVPSEYLAGIVRGWGVADHKIRVIYNATDPHPGRGANAKPGTGPYKLITVCRLVPWKGVDSLLEALTRMDDVHLTVVGDGPSASELKGHAESLGVGERVTWTGSVPNADVRNFLGAADAFVLNSTYEGLPHIVLEAFEERTPVIATAVGGTPELVRHEQSGLLVEPARPDQIVAAVQRLRSDPTLNQTLVDGALEALSGQFSLTAMIEAYADVLKTAARSQKRGSLGHAHSP